MTEADAIRRQLADRVDPGDVLAIVECKACSARWYYLLDGGVDGLAAIAGVLIADLPVHECCSPMGPGL